MLYRFDNIEKSYGPHDIVKGATWQHNRVRRLVWSTAMGGEDDVFRLLLKQEDTDHGQVLRASGLTSAMSGSISMPSRGVAF
jgi:hypothetical protein